MKAVSVRDPRRQVRRRAARLMRQVGLPPRSRTLLADLVRHLASLLVQTDDLDRQLAEPLTPSARSILEKRSARIGRQVNAVLVQINLRLPTKNPWGGIVAAKHQF